MPLSYLPRTILDAVYVVRKLDISYIWVNSLSAIQVGLYGISSHSRGFEVSEGVEMRELRIVWGVSGRSF
jgi:hypothetical protein